MANDLLKLSVSKWKTFDSCAKKYHYAYILRLPKKDATFHILGKFVHQVLENFHKSILDMAGHELHKLMNKAYGSALKTYGSSLSNDSKKEAYEIIDGYLKNISSDQSSLTKTVGVEKIFNIQISEDVVMTGMIDRIDRDADKVLHIIDYKTTKNLKYLKNDFLQLLTYAYAMYCEDNSITKVRCSYLLLRHNYEYITKEFALNDILEVKTKYEQYAETIRQEQLWRPNVSGLCRFCDFIDQCEEGKLATNQIVKVGEEGW